jgi:hypothetical protein
MADTAPKPLFLPFLCRAKASASIDYFVPHLPIFASLTRTAHNQTRHQRYIDCTSHMKALLYVMPTTSRGFLWFVASLVFSAQFSLTMSCITG